MRVYSLNTVVVGSGAAGYNAADRLHTYGQADIAVVTEGRLMGTSRNTGSDKQTYYKLSLAGDTKDSVRDMAKTLFDGGAMHGDIALCEAALSAQCFYRLVELGVPFPHNRFGEYPGYKTDHDPLQRATSAGPLTSRYMTEALERQVMAKGIRIFDGYKAVAILVCEGTCVGLLALDRNKQADRENRFALFNCTNVILATGGPAKLYKNSVYPESQTGAAGIAFEAGARGRNLAVWQHGIAAVKFRWNLSGSYQQALPRYISTDAAGGDGREFLEDYFKDPRPMLENIFLKGYQWPFDIRKTLNCGSSMIDVLVRKETEEKGRRVFLDYTRNPSALRPDFSNLGQVPKAYLSNSGALQATPIERLAQLNQPAIDLFRSNGIDLRRERLEIAVCAQHNNGGLAVDTHWETNIRHLFAAGEAAGTHGIYRPGGTALNAGQAGSTRAAQHIAKAYREPPLPEEEFLKRTEKQVKEKQALAESFLKNGSEDLATAFEAHDLQTAREVYTLAHQDYILHGGDTPGYTPTQIQEISYDKGQILPTWTPIHPLPPNHDWFENVWKEYQGSIKGK